MANRHESRSGLLDSEQQHAFQQQYDAQQYDPRQSYGNQDAYNYNQPTYQNGASYKDQQAYSGTNYHDAAGGQAQSSFVPSAYADNSQVNYNQGYAAREGMAQTTPAAKPPRDNFEFLKSKWPALFMLTTVVQAMICLAFEAYVFGKFQLSLGEYQDSERAKTQYLTIPTFLTLFIFGFLYECVVVWDALRKKNTIQIIGVCVANLMILVYTTTQVDQIKGAIHILGAYNALKPGMTADQVWDDVKPFLVAGPVVNAVATIIMGFIAWKLYQVFAWDILKIIGADYRMKKRFFYYQVRSLSSRNKTFSSQN